MDEFITTLVTRNLNSSSKPNSRDDKLVYNIDDCFLKQMVAVSIVIDKIKHLNFGISYLLNTIAQPLQLRHFHSPGKVVMPLSHTNSNSQKSPLKSQTLHNSAL